MFKRRVNKFFILIITMSSLKGLGGRLCNHVIMNLCFSILAEITPTKKKNETNFL